MKQILNIKLKRLNSQGIGHHALVALLIISGIAGFGAWRVYDSNAATASAASLHTGSKEGCTLAGFKWDSGKKKCVEQCADGSKVKRAGIQKAFRKYCPNSLTPGISQKHCSSVLKRVYINGRGCTKAKKSAESAPQCFDKNYPNYKVNHKGNTDFCLTVDSLSTQDIAGNSKGKVGSVGSTTTLIATPKAPLLSKPASMPDQQWKTINPRYGMSFEGQARIYKASVETIKAINTWKVAERNTKCKDQGPIMHTNNTQYECKNWRDYYKHILKGDSIFAKGLPRWMDGNSANDNFMQYNPNKKWIDAEEYGTCVNGVQHLTKQGYKLTEGYNPNFFSSFEDQRSWVTKNKILVDTRYASQDFGTTCDKERKKNPKYIFYVAFQNNDYYYSDGWGPKWGSEYGNKFWDPSGDEPDYNNLPKPNGWNPAKGTSPFKNPTPFLK